MNRLRHLQQHWFQEETEKEEESEWQIKKETARCSRLLVLTELISLEAK